MPIEETVGAMAELVEQGKVLYIGMSEAAPRPSGGRTRSTRSPPCRPSIRCSPATSRTSSSPTCRELGIGFVPTRRSGAASSPARCRRTSSTTETSAGLDPRFPGENLEANLRLAAKVEEIAAEKASPPAQLAIAWVLAAGRGSGTDPRHQRRSYLEQNAAAVDVELTEEDLSRIDAELPEAAGERYDEAGMATVNL